MLEPRPEYPHTVLITDTDNDGIAREVVYATRVAAEMYAGQHLTTTPQELHRLIAKEIQYEADDDPNGQRLRMPWRTLIEGKTDCKSSAIFIGGVSLAQGRHVVIRFVDEDGAGSWSHVYAIVDGDAADPLLTYGTHPRAAVTCDVDMAPI